MEELLRRFPDQLLEGYDSASRQAARQRVTPVPAGILFCGMGGSAVGAMLLTNLLEKPAVPIRLHTSYGLPAQLKDSPLGVFISYSGETEETLSAYREARMKRLKRVAVTSGGKLGEWAERDGAPLIRVPAGYPPRMALPFLLTAGLALLGKASKSGFAKELESAAASLKRGGEHLQTEARRIAEFIVAQGGIPIVWGVAGVTNAVGYRWRTQMNENSKMLAFTHNFPELCHNEIVPVTLTDIPLAILTLETTGDGPTMKRRRALALDVITEKNPNLIPIAVKAKSATRFAAVLELVWLGDWVSYFLARLNGVDPAPVAPIVELKRRMGPSK